LDKPLKTLAFSSLGRTNDRNVSDVFQWHAVELVYFFTTIIDCRLAWAIVESDRIFSDATSYLSNYLTPWRPPPVLAFEKCDKLIGG
jgi:hypothetical protein